MTDLSRRKLLGTALLTAGGLAAGVGEPEAADAKPGERPAHPEPKPRATPGVGVSPRNRVSAQVVSGSSRGMPRNSNLPLAKIERDTRGCGSSPPRFLTVGYGFEAVPVPRPEVIAEAAVDGVVILPAG